VSLPLSLFSRSFCIVKIAFNLLPCAVCHFLPRPRSFSILRTHSKCTSGTKQETPTERRSMTWLQAFLQAGDARFIANYNINLPFVGARSKC
jgi:hypothetical protein